MDWNASFFLLLARGECLHALDAKSIDHLIHINTYDTIAVEFGIIKGFSFVANIFVCVVFAIQNEVSQRKLRSFWNTVLRMDFA